MRHLAPSVAYGATSPNGRFAPWGRRCWNVSPPSERSERWGEYGEAGRGANVALPSLAPSVAYGATSPNGRFAPWGRRCWNVSPPSERSERWGEYGEAGRGAGRRPECALYPAWGHSAKVGRQML